MDSDAKAYQELRFELTRFATALVGPSEAEDVVADVVVRVLERPGGLGGLKDPRPYLIRAIINEARSRFRRRRLGGSLEVPAETDSPQVDYRDQLVEIVSKLPPRQKAATFLVY